MFPILEDIRMRRMAATCLVVVVLILLSFLAACGGPTPTVQVLVVTATFTPGQEPQAREVVTATFTPTPAVQIVTATSSPAPQLVPTKPPTPTPEPTDTLPPPQPPMQPTITATPLPPTPTDTSLPPTSTDTPIPPTPTDTSTPIPPTNTPRPQPTATRQASLASYGVIYSNFDGGDETDENKYSVWIMRGDGNQASELIRPAIEPAFSPSGNKIAYYRPFNGIWVYDVNAKTNSHIVASDYAEFASFSPNGQRLVYHEWVGNWWSADVNLYIVNADGSGRTQLPQGIRPAWAPKGGLIAFDSCRGTSCGIFVIQPNGQGFRQVTSDGGGKVSWSPNGSKLVYSAEVGGDPEIWVVNVDGSGRRQLTNNSGNDTLPVYSPDGRYIYFLSDQNGQAWAILAMNADGSNVKTIHRVGVPPRWQFSRLWIGWW